MQPEDTHGSECEGEQDRPGKGDQGSAGGRGEGEEKRLVREGGYTGRLDDDVGWEW
jgi:hypothetical protein